MPDMQAPERIDPQRLEDYLNVMSKAVFQTGISWRVVESKWPGTQEAFHHFDVVRVADLTPVEIDELAVDTRIIRNRKKIEAIQHNAQRMLDLEREHGTFRDYLRSKPSFTDLGDMGTCYFLYVVGEEVPPHEEFMSQRKGRAS